MRKIRDKPVFSTRFNQYIAIPPSTPPRGIGDHMMRISTVERKTAETRVCVQIDLDGNGSCKCNSGIGFFDHMLEQLGRHSMIDLSVKATGDMHIDDHHTVEDVGIVLGQALAEAVGDKAGIRRYGSCQLPMDDAWIDVALDVSGRPNLAWDVAMPRNKIGSFDSELVREFFQAFAMNAGITLHVSKRSGFNTHHIAEATFKAVARALRMAFEPDPRNESKVPSTKGLL